MSHRPQLQSAAWTTEQLEQDLLSGNWCAALTDGEQALADGHQAARPLAQQALASSHAAWLRVAGLPPWLAAYDMHRRERLFGDLLEPSADLNPEWSQVLSGQEAAWRAVASQEGDSLLTQLIDTASQPANIRRDRLQGIAQRLPIEQPEHWLAQTIVRHLRKDRAGAEQAAEMAWLTGAGELAVLLDAALAMPTADASQRAALWRRIAKADREDCPASTLLLLQLQTRGTGNATFEPSVAHAFPTTHRPNAASWFLAQANLATERQRLMLLRISVALAAGLRRVLPLTLGLTFLVLPSTSTRIFRAFLCETFEYDEGVSQRYLYADLTLSCDSDEYESTKATALVMLAVWPVGVPMLYAVLLWASRKALSTGHPTSLSRATAFLSGDYEVATFWWEPLEMCRKLTLTGWVLLIRGNAEQARVIVALFVSISFFGLNLRFKPLRQCAAQASLNTRATL